MKKGALFLVLSMALLPVLALVMVTPVDAQCGSSASSCKNCHEVNAEYPVNASGEWHVSHAFGDFCSFCHAGNVQAVEKDAAHEGMIYPLSDVAGSCQTCHPNDYMEQAGVYAVALGVDLSAADGGGPGSGGGAQDLADIVSKPISAPGERHASGALIDFNRRYEIEVLGLTDTSQLGNLIVALAGMALLAVGGALVWKFENLGEAWRKARAVPDEDWRRLAYSGAYETRGPVVPGRPRPASGSDVGEKPVSRGEKNV